MTYPTIDEREARAWWRAWNEAAKASDPPARCEPPTPPATRKNDLGRPHEWSRIAGELVEDLIALIESADNYARFEAAAGVMIHRKLPFDLALSDPEFWTWFAVEPGRELVLARYRETEASPIPGRNNFTSPSGKETLFYRLWLRSDLAYDSNAEDPYWLAKYGDIDFWRSHVFRQLFAEHRPLVAAFARFQYPDGPEGGARLKGKNQSHIRALVKYLKRALANVDAGLMDEDRAMTFIENQWDKVVQAGLPE